MQASAGRALPWPACPARGTSGHRAATSGNFWVARWPMRPLSGIGCSTAQPFRQREQPAKRVGRSRLRRGKRGARSLLVPPSGTSDPGNMPERRSLRRLSHPVRQRPRLARRVTDTSAEFHRKANSRCVCALWRSAPRTKSAQPRRSRSSVSDVAVIRSAASGSGDVWPIDRSVAATIRPNERAMTDEAHSKLSAGVRSSRGTR